MVIAERLRAAREQKNLSQGDIEQKTGLLRCYISRVENGHTVPAVETLEKLARAFDMPLYQLLYDGEEPPQPDAMRPPQASAHALWGASGKEARYLRKLRHYLARMKQADRELLLFTALRMTRQKNRGDSN